MTHRLPPKAPKRRPKRVKRFRFSPTDRIRYGGRTYIYLREIEGGHAFREYPAGIEQCVTDSEMQAIVADPDFALDRNFFGPMATAARTAGLETSLADLPEDEQGIIVRKVYYCRRFLELEAESRLPDATARVTRSDASMTAAIGRIHEEIKDSNDWAAKNYPQRKDIAGKVPQIVVKTPPTSKTLRKWLATYEVTGGYPIALRDRRVVSGNRMRRLDPAVQRIINEQCTAYQTEARLTAKACHKGALKSVQTLNETRAAQGLPLLPKPSIAAVRRAIGRLPKFQTHARRHGIEAARKKFRLVSRTLEVLRPGERVEMDEWKVQLQLILEGSELWSSMSDEQRRLCSGRWIVCVAIDVATKARLAMCLAPTATASLAKRTLEMMLIDKTDLVPDAVTPWDMALSPDTIVTDGGAAFTSTEFVSAIADLRARHDVPPGGMPHLRGSVERSFSQLNVGFLQFFTGRTFSTTVEKGDYDPQVRASMTKEAFARALAIYNADVYNNTPHDGLGGETPRAAWLRLTGEYGVCPPPGSHDRRAIFGTEIRRELSLRGVRFLGLHYSDDELGRQVLEEGLGTVVIRVDETNLGHVSLRTADGWRPLPCRTKAIEGVSVREFTAVLEDLRLRHASANEVTLKVVLDALDRIRAIAAHAEAQAGIVLQVLGTERLEAEERALLVNLDIDIDGGGDEDDFPVEVIPTGPAGGPLPADGAAAVATDYGMEDE